MRNIALGSLMPNRSFLLLCAIVMSPTAYADWEVRNGGDAVDCVRDTGEELQGKYILDYILTYDDPDAAPLISSPAPWQVIQANLEAKLPSLGYRLRGFIMDAQAQIFSGPEHWRANIWTEEDLRTTLIDDEAILGELQVPENCLDDRGRLRIEQLVARDFRIANTHFAYDPEILREIMTRPVQYSFLLIHEWLWEFAFDARVIREANRFLQSVEPLGMTGEEISRRLDAIGSHIGGGIVQVDHPVAVLSASGEGFELSTNRIEVQLSRYLVHYLSLVNHLSEPVVMYDSGDGIVGVIPAENFSNPLRFPIDVTGLPVYYKLCEGFHCLSSDDAEFQYLQVVREPPS